MKRKGIKFTYKTLRTFLKSVYFSRILWYNKKNKKKELIRMDRTKILGLIKSLAKSQGFYGRLLESINENPEILDHLEQQNFKEELDLILYLEQ